MVTLKLENGSTPVVPVTRLSEADQAHITAWRKANPADIRYNFNIEHTFDNKKIPLIKTNEILSIDSDPVQLEVTQLSAALKFAEWNYQFIIG